MTDASKIRNATVVDCAQTLRVFKGGAINFETKQSVTAC